MKDSKFLNALTRKVSITGLKIKKYSPELLVGAGIIGLVTSTVLACKSTTKANAIIKKAKEDVEQIHSLVKEPELVLPEIYTKEDSKKDLTITYAQTGVKLLKVYGPAIGLGVLSITSILAGTNILKKRNVALAAAYTTIDKSFKSYRNRVVERFGDELDKELKYNIKSKEIQETVIDENGKETTVTKTVNVLDNPINMYTAYARCFDDGNPGWKKDSEHNLWYLRQQQNWANDKLKVNGYLFLNDVYELLGFPKSKAGQVVGWVYNEKHPIGDNYVDFGIYDTYKEGSRDFVNGYERSIWLDFNVDGNIMEFI